MNSYNFKNKDSYRIWGTETGRQLYRPAVGQISGWTPDGLAQKSVGTLLPVAKVTSNQLLAAQSDKDLSRLLPFLEKVELASNEYLYRPGDEINHLYFPESAAVSEFQILDDGRTIEVSLTGREGVVGVSSIFNSQPALHWTQASIAGSALKLSINILKQEFKHGSSLERSFFGYVGAYIGQISQRVICNSHHTVEERFCSWLLMLCNRNRSRTLSLTQEQIARLLGVHRPSVTQIAQKLRARKIIDYVRGKIFIVDAPALEKTACTCYATIDKMFDALDGEDKYSECQPDDRKSFTAASSLAARR